MNRADGIPRRRGRTIADGGALRDEGQGLAAAGFATAFFGSA